MMEWPNYILQSFFEEKYSEIEIPILFEFEIFIKK